MHQPSGGYTFASSASSDVHSVTSFYGHGISIKAGFTHLWILRALLHMVVDLEVCGEQTGHLGLLGWPLTDGP